MKTHSLRRYLPWILILSLFAGCEDPDLVFAPQIGDMSLAELLKGDEAGDAINRLHGTSIDMRRAYVAHYKGVGEKASIWVSEAPTEQLAVEQIRVMLDKMKNNVRSPFKDYRDFKKEGFEIIAFTGIGQIHYVFKANKWVYWISADARRIDNMLQHVLKAPRGFAGGVFTWKQE